MTRKTMFLLMLVMALTMLVSASWATVIQDVEVVGKFFNPRPGSTQLCAQISPSYSGAHVRFVGETPYGTEFTAQYAYTNAWGLACIKTNWPQGVYKVKAKVSAVNNSSGLLQVPSYKSDPAAVSVFNPNNFCGAQGGGALYLNSYDVGKTVRQTLQTRKATFAFIFKKSPPNNFGIFYFDNDHPLSAVKFETTHWFDSNILYFNAPDYASFELIGMGWAKTGNYDGPVHYYLYADTFPGFSKFFIALWDPAGNLVYRSAPWDNGVVPELRVFEGKVVVTPCLNGEDWPCQDCP